MASPQDTKLAVLVIRDRLLTPEQLEECRQIQQRLAARQGPRSLAQIIVARHYASADQLRDLVAKEIGRRTGSRPVVQLTPNADLEREDVELARKLIAHRIVDEAKCRECLALTRRAREQKPDVRFAQVVLKKGYATREALKSVLEALPPISGRYGLPPTVMRPAFDAAALGGSSSSSAPVPPVRPPTGRYGPATDATPSQSQSVGRLFNSPSSGPQPLFGEASGVIKPMFGYEGSSAQANALPFRGSSARLAKVPGPPSRGTSAARPVAAGFFDAAVPPPQPPPQAPPAPPQQQRPQPPGLDPWGANQQPQPWPRDARGNFQTVELDPRDPGIPQLGGAAQAFPFGFEGTESPTKRDVHGDPFGEGRLDSKEFNAFDSVRNVTPARRDDGRGAPQPRPNDFIPFDEPAAPSAFANGPGTGGGGFDNPFGVPSGHSDEPIGLGKGSSGVASLVDSTRPTMESWGPPPGMAGFPPATDGFGPPPSLGFDGPAIDVGSQGFGDPAPMSFGAPGSQGFGAPGFGAPGSQGFGAPGSQGFGPIPGTAEGFSGAAFGGSAFGGSDNFAGDPFGPSGAGGNASFPGGSEPGLPAADLGFALAGRRDTAQAGGSAPFLDDLPSDAPTDPDSADRDKKVKKRTTARRDRTPPDDEEGAPRRGGVLKWVVLVVVLVALGGGGFAGYRIYTDRAAVTAAENAFLDAQKASASQRDPRAALKLGEALGDASKVKPEIRDALNALRGEVGVLDDKEEAKKLVESITEAMSPQDRLDTSEKAIRKDSQNARAFLEHARARIALGRTKGAKAFAIARTAAATEDLPFAEGLDPKLLDAFWELANLQELSGPGREQMRGQLERIRDADKEGYLGLLAAGRLRALAKNDPRAVPEAIELFSRAVEAKPDSALPHLIRGRFRLVTNHFEGAFRDGDEAVRLTGRKSAEALTLLAWARREEKGDLNGCKRDLEEAIALDKSWAPAFGQRALLRWQQGDVKGAEDDARTALQIDEGEPSALLAQASMSALTKANSLSFVADTKRMNEARRLLRVAIERDDHMVTAILLYGRLAFRDNDNETAFRSFTRVLEIDPQNAPALGNRGMIYMAQRKFSEARADLDKAIDIDPRFEKALYIRGKLKVEGDPKDFDGAVADLTKAIAIAPEYAEAYLIRAVAYHQSGRMNEAILDASAALNKGDKAFLASRRHEALYVRGVAHFEKKQWKEALDDLTAAQTGAPAGASFLSKVGGFIATAKENLEKSEAPPETPPEKKPEEKPAEKPAEGK